MIDTTGMSPEQIREALEDLTRAATKVDAKQNALKQMDHVLHDRLQSEGIGPGRPWVQPEDASDAYPIKWVTEKDGKLYSSNVSVNESTPGESDTWTLLSVKPSRPPETIEGEVEDHAA